MTDAQRIRQLEQQLADCDDGVTPTNITKRIDLVNELAWLLCDTDMKRGYALAENAYSLANSLSADDPPYQIGMAYCLRTQGYLNMRFGNYAQGLAQLLRALPLCEALQLHDGLPDVYDGITATYFVIGSYPEALANAYKQLETAQRINDQKRIINAYNNVAAVQFETGDYAQAIETMLLNLRLARTIKYTRVECITHINLGEMYLAVGDHEIAIEHGLHGLQMSQEFDYTLFEIYALQNLGQCYLKVADAPKALPYLEKAMELSRSLELKVMEAMVLLALGEAHRSLQQFEQAQTHVHRAITLAQSIENNKEVYQGHLLLSELYEQTGDFAQALAHFKQHQAAKEVVFNEKADERLKVLQVAHDTATAKQEAEIAHLRTVELQREITKHSQAEQQLQRQLEYMRALSAFKQILLTPTHGEADEQRILREALRHLLKPTRAKMLMVYRNVDDPELGPYSQILVSVFDDVSVSLQAEVAYGATLAEYQELLKQAQPDIAERGNEFIATTFPHSLIPPVVNRQLMAGTWIGGQIAELFADAPTFRDFLIQKAHLHSLLLFPIQIDGQWWGTIGMTEAAVQPARATAEEPHRDGENALWSEDEILMLGTAAEMVTSAIKRWQVESNLRSLNGQLEQQVVEQTAELRNTVAQLHIEIEERQHAESALQAMTTSLEQRLADRTQELATFFDLTVLGGRSADLSDVLEFALPRILEVSHSQAVCVHLLDTGRQHLSLAAQQDVPLRFRPQLARVELSPQFRNWLENPHEPLLIAKISQLKVIPAAFQLADFQAYLGVQISVGQQIEGVLSCYRFGNNSFGLDEIALVTAIGEQMGTVLETHRLRRQAAELAVLEERQRLARDLHDSVTQSLYSLSLFSRVGREATEDNDTDRLHHSLSQIESTTLHALRDMRLLLYELHPIELKPEGFKQAIELRLDMVERRIGLRADVKLDDLIDIPYNDVVQLFYVTIEALNNVVKHASATQLTVQLVQENRDLRLQILDNGKGFDPSQTKGGLGLRNIRERVTQLNGKLAIFSEPDNGTKLEVVIPL